jgi:hypothetical protein
LNPWCDWILFSENFFILRLVSNLELRMWFQPHIHLPWRTVLISGIFLEDLSGGGRGKGAKGKNQNGGEPFISISNRAREKLNCKNKCQGKTGMQKRPPPHGQFCQGKNNRATQEKHTDPLKGVFIYA